MNVFHIFGQDVQWHMDGAHCKCITYFMPGPVPSTAKLNRERVLCKLSANNHDLVKYWNTADHNERFLEAFGITEDMLLPNHKKTGKQKQSQIEAHNVSDEIQDDEPEGVFEINQ